LLDKVRCGIRPSEAVQETGIAVRTEEIPMLPGAQKDGPQITEDRPRLGKSIDGVSVREVRHVPRDHGVITEIFRPEWDPTGLPVVHVYQSRLFPGAIGAWSCHAKNIDR